jgi:hypothetical protein
MRDKKDSSCLNYCTCPNLVLPNPSTVKRKISFLAVKATCLFKTRTRLRPEPGGIRSGHGDRAGGGFRVGSVPTPRHSQANKANRNPRGENPQKATSPPPTRRSSCCRACRRRHLRKRSPRPWRRASSSTSPRGSAPSPPPRRSVRTLAMHLAVWSVLCNRFGSGLGF